VKTLVERIAEDRLTLTSIPLISDGPERRYGVEIHCPGQTPLRLPHGFASESEPTVEQVMRYILNGCKGFEDERDPASMPISTYLYWTRLDTGLFDLLGSVRRFAYLDETEW
jgi:hypothetical protein